MLASPAPSIGGTYAYRRKKPKRISVSEHKGHHVDDKPVLFIESCLTENCHGVFEDIFSTFRVFCLYKKHARDRN
jgi:hypothetical protein